jgi:hypothetical protein
MGIIALSAAICRNRGLERLAIAGNDISQVRPRPPRSPAPPEPLAPPRG